MNLRAAPSFNATLLGSVPGGATVRITCQSYGTKVNGSFIWDYIGNGYVSNYFVNGTPPNAFDGRIPRCPGNYQPVDCSQTLFLGARGSDQELGPRGMGSEAANDVVDYTFRRVAALGGNLHPAGVVYPAHSVWLLPADRAGYFAGKDQGTEELLRLLRKRTDGNVCGWQNTKAVLVGYSQGAMVVGDAINRMTSAERSTVRAVVTFGNPHYTFRVNGDVSYIPGVPVAGYRGWYPDNVGSRSQDYCNWDIVCSTKIDVLGYYNHGTYVGLGYAERAAQFLRSRI